MDERRPRARGTDRPVPGARRAGCGCPLWGPVALVAVLGLIAAFNWSSLATAWAQAEMWARWQLALRGLVNLGPAPATVTPGAFATEQFTGAGGRRMTYYLYLPPGYQPSRRYPIVLLLHGVGESAVAGATPAQNRDRLIEQRYVQAWVTPAVQAQWPCFVVVPQVPQGTRWIAAPGEQGSHKLAARPTAALQTAMEVVVTLEAHYPSIDRNRLYAAGISEGASGVWDAITRWPALFAAAAPLAGAGDPARARALAHLPIWDFHGSADSSVPVAASRQMYAAIRAAGDRSCYTEFPGQTHDLWNTVQVYNDPTFQRWLFAQTRAPTAATRPTSCAGLVVAGVPAR